MSSVFNIDNQPPVEINNEDDNNQDPNNPQYEENDPVITKIVDAFYAGQ